MLRRRVAGFGAALFAAWLAEACGARTSLDLPEPCTHLGQTRPCADQCGAGSESCLNGFWTACTVPVATRACTNDCGAGTQTCTSNAWSACDVPMATRTCTNDCGSGTQTCSDGVWQTACTVPVVMRDCSSACGSGHETCTDGVWGACDAPRPKPPKLAGRIRDFHRTQPDFEITLPAGTVGFETGIVKDTLGDDDKPVYNGNPATVTTSGKANFDVWYRDSTDANGVPINKGEDLQVQLVESAATPGLFIYDNTSFFPIDDQLFGNEGLPHNYHFTFEVHTSFVYRGGELFSFAGDDDMWVFINRKLAIDLGGLHETLSADVSLDQIAPTFGLSVGGEYSLAFFFAERHTFASDFTVRTTIASAGTCP